MLIRCQARPLSTRIARQKHRRAQIQITHVRTKLNCVTRLNTFASTYSPHGFNALSIMAQPNMMHVAHPEQMSQPMNQSYQPRPGMPQADQAQKPPMRCHVHSQGGRNQSQTSYFMPPRGGRGHVQGHAPRQTPQRHVQVQPSWLNIPAGQRSAHVAVHGNVVQINLGQSPDEAMVALQEFDDSVRSSVIAAFQQNAYAARGQNMQQREVSQAPTYAGVQRAASQAGHAVSMPQHQMHNPMQQQQQTHSIGSDLGIPTAGGPSEDNAGRPQTMMNPATNGPALEGARQVQGGIIR